MKTFIAGFILMLAMVSGAIAQPPADLAWNRFETQNFEILTISKEHGEKLQGEIEYMRRWIFDRWGMKQNDLSVKCKILVVSDRATYVKLFGKETPMHRIERDGKNIKSLTIWCWADEHWFVSTLPAFVTEVLMAEFESVHGVRLPLWFRRGMLVLNRNVPDIRREVGAVAQTYTANTGIFWTSDLMTMRPETLAQYDVGNQTLYDRESAVFCLYLMKTHGRKKMLDFVNASMADPEKALVVLGMANRQQLDTAFNEFMYRLSTEAATGSTPVSKLTWDSK